MSLETAVQDFVNENSGTNHTYGTHEHYIVVAYDDVDLVRKRRICTYDFSNDVLIQQNVNDLLPTFDNVE